MRSISTNKMYVSAKSTQHVESFYIVCMVTDLGTI